jgi:hypothetical protein
MRIRVVLIVAPCQLQQSVNIDESLTHWSAVGLDGHDCRGRKHAHHDAFNPNPIDSSRGMTITCVSGDNTTHNSTM